MSNHKRLYRKIFDEISYLIHSGEFTIGSRLPTERELAERFEVSRPTIREAIIALEATNKVSVKTGSGVYVIDQKSKNTFFDKETSPFEVLEARVLLEGESAALAAKMITEDEKVLLQKAFMNLKGEGLNGESREADREFHSIIANATHNKVLAHQIHTLWELQETSEHIKETHQAVCNTQDTERINEHKEIMLAVINHDSKAARKAMHYHFSHVLESMHSMIEEEALKAARLKGSQMRKRYSLDLYAGVE
ncbi:MAG: FadR family transcriptional regulator [Acidiferrobacterales bacterium]|nr:FadR family transcriptional regulator [Acidiferrobacterales bacterium]